MPVMQAVEIGSRVKVLDLQTQREREFQIVPTPEANPLEGRISLATPIAKALLGRSVGEEVVALTPGGKKSFRIVDYF